MGSYSILVIGDWRKKLEPLLQAEYIGNPFSPHIRCTNILNHALRKDFRLSQKKIRQRERVSFPLWLKQQCGLNTLASDEKVDLSGAHRSGWVQLNKKGEVTEVIRRNQDAVILYVSGSIEQFLLKPGAIGWIVKPDKPKDLEITQGYASSARMCDIDFNSMRQLRDQYVQHASVLDYQEVLFDGKFLGTPDETALLSGLGGDTLLTSVVVKI